MKNLIFALSVVGLSLTASNAFAQDDLGELTGYCNEGGENGLAPCDCPEEATGTVASYDQLPRFDEPEKIRATSNLNAIWNSSESVWDITLDTTAMPGEGVIVVTDEAGRYDSIGHLFNHISQLLGHEINPTINSAGEVKLPAVRIKQVGGTARLYDASGVAQWAESNTRVFLYDAITDQEGKLWIAGDEALDFFATKDGCGGDDPESDDFNSNSALEVEQCSNKESGPSGLLDENSCQEDFGQNTCILLSATISTNLETGYYANAYVDLEPRFRCTGITGTTPPLRCDTSSSGEFTRVRQIADSLELTSVYFDNAQPPSPAFLVPDSDSANQESELTQSASEYGICSEGESEKGSAGALITRTREGSYSASINACDW